VSKRPVALYHVVHANEGFEEAARMVHQIVLKAGRTSPGAARALYLDIDSHRTPNGAFDHDMFELQHHFILARKPGCR
jgi:hypothetical protein